MSGIGTSAAGRRCGRGSRGHAKSKRPMAIVARLVARGNTVSSFEPRASSR
jgi:hypothetical protein